MPRVVVAVPTFNRAGYLGETLESLVGQTYRDRLIRVVDDGSTDETADVVSRFQSRYPGEIDYRYQENSGEGSAVNTAWETSESTYFACVSSDDPMPADWLAGTTEFMDANPDVIVGYPDWNVIDENSKLLWENPVFEYSRAALVGWAYCLPGPGTLIRRAALGDVTALRNPKYPLTSDYECWLRLSLKGPFARIPATLANWRLHDGAATMAASRDALSGDFRQVLKDFFARPDLPPDVRRCRRSAMSRAHWITASILSETRPARSLLHYAMSLALARRNPPGLPDLLQRPAPRTMVRQQVGRMRTRLSGRLRRLAGSFSGAS